MAYNAEGDRYRNCYRDFNAPLFDQLLTSAQTNAEDRHRQSTQDNYGSDERSWIRFCDEIQHPPHKYNVRNPGDKMVAYAQHRRNQKAKGRNTPITRETIIRNIRGIRATALTKSNVAVGDLPLISEKDNPKLWALLKSFHDDSQAKIAIRAPLLSKMIAKLNIQRCDDAIRAAAMAVSHNSIRRGSETTQEAKGGLKPRMFRWETGGHYPASPLVANEGSVSIRFDVSKTNKNRAPQTAYLWCRCNTTRKYKYPCALHLVKHLFNLRPNVGINEPITMLSTGKIYDVDAFRNDVQELYQQCTGNDMHDVGTHSLRSGGYQDAKEEGHSEQLILQQAYWKSMKSAIPYEERRRTYDAVDAKKRAELKR